MKDHIVGRLTIFLPNVASITYKYKYKYKYKYMEHRLKMGPYLSHQLMTIYRENKNPANVAADIFPQSHTAKHVYWMKITKACFSFSKQPLLQHVPFS